MLTRRRFTTLALGSSALTGCAGFLRLHPVDPVDAPGTIDVHVHFINGSDVPVLGFLKQVNFVDEHGGGGVPGLVKSPLIAFIVGLLADLTPTAADELDALPRAVSRALPRRSREVLEAGDEDRLAGYLERYQQGQTETQSIARPVTRSMASAAVPGDSEILAILEDAAGTRPNGAMVRVDKGGRAVPLPPEARPTARDTARGLLDPNAQRGDPQRLSIAGLVRWAILLTRPRAEIMQQAFALYGRPTEARVFCNQMLDLEFWLTELERNQSPLGDQIELMSELARRERQVLVLNFAPFCPLRAVAEGIVRTLDRIKEAVETKGFAGVKLYPPMGFRPDGNRGVSLAHSDRPRLNPADMDRALTALYVWCGNNDVPIASHASRSMGAGPGTEAYAAPQFWGPVLERHRRLRVNLAHFGGFRRHGDKWDEELVNLVRTRPNLYFDTGYWTEAAQGQASHAAELALTRAILEDEPELKRRMLYGSDWSMIAKEPDHPRYLLDKQKFLGAVTGNDDAERDAILGGNARRWLGIDRWGQQAERLEGFFGDHPAWRQIAPS